MDPTLVAAFHDELEKISSAAAQGDGERNRITRERLARLVRYGVPGAVGAGVGYAGVKLVGRPLEKALLKSNLVGKNPARALKYSAGLGTGLAMATALAQTSWADKLADRVRHGDVKKQ